ncbi:hypothetical protein CSUI_008332, partial [Cystoisospora suis]
MRKFLAEIEAKLHTLEESKKSLIEEHENVIKDLKESKSEVSRQLKKNEEEVESLTQKLREEKKTRSDLSHAKDTLEQEKNREIQELRQTK